MLARRRGAVVVRPGDVYGPGSRQWAIRPLEAMKSGRLVLPRGRDGMVTPVYIDDLVDCLVLAASSEAAEPGQAYVAWPGQVVSGADFMAYYARMLGRPGVPRLPGTVHRAAVWLEERVARVAGRPPTVTAAAMRYLNREHAYSVSRARERLGWEPRVDLDEGMRRTEAWFREEGLLPSPLADAHPFRRRIAPGIKIASPGYPQAERGAGARCPSLPRHVRHRRLRGRARSTPDEGALERMAAALGHRGPDDRGVEVVGNVGLVHTRLSIVDPSPAGHQPMVDDVGRLVADLQRRGLQPPRAARPS